MDRRCVYYHKPLLESGTLGTKGNVQVLYSNSNCHIATCYSAESEAKIYLHVLRPLFCLFRYLVSYIMCSIINSNMQVKAKSSDAALRTDHDEVKAN